MAISKIKAMAATLNEMKQMKDSVTEEVNKDISEKRKQAFLEISAYMDEIADALEGEEIKVKVETQVAKNIFARWKSDKFIIYVGFNAKYRKDSSGYLSDDKRKWWISRVNTQGYEQEDGYRYKYTEGRFSYNHFIDSDVIQFE